MMGLRNFILLPHRWSWGGVGGEDCTTFTASWVEEVTGQDPAAGLRGKYSTAEDAARILDAHGGCEGLLGTRLSTLGLNRTSDPMDGDVGVVRCMTGFDADGMMVKEIPGIRFGPLWAVMSARGPMVKQLDWTGAAWRIV